MHGFFVCVLRGCETRFVNSVVDVVVGPVVGVLDLLLQILGEKMDVFVFLGEQIVKLAVEHADYLCGLIGYDSFGFLVVKSWDGKAAFVGGIDGEVNFAEVGEFRVKGVFCGVLAGDLFVVLNEAPA